MSYGQGMGIMVGEGRMGGKGRYLFYIFRFITIFLQFGTYYDVYKSYGVIDRLFSNASVLD